MTKTTYDADSRPTLVEKRLYVGGVETWQQWSTGYTPTGQKWWEKDPQNDITRFEYDALDHKTAEIAPTGDKTGFVYNLAGQMTQIRKAVGISCSGQPAGFACEQAEQTFTYSPNGQKTSLTDARSNTTSFVFDIHDRLLRTVFPDATWEGSATNSGDYDAALYDKAGNVLKFRTREGTYMSRTYDNLDRKTAEQGLWTDGTSVGNTVQAWRMRSGSFAYTLAGRMSSATTDQVTKAWTYDTAGRPYTHTATMASGVPNTVAQTFTYGWDVASNLTSLVYPGNLTATYVYDANNRMTGVSTTGAAAGAVTLAYDTLSRRTSTTATGNSSQTYAYELDNDVSSISHAFPSETALNVSFSWTYDAMGRQVSETISNSAYQYLPPTASTTFGAANSLNQYPTAGADSFSYRSDGPMSSDGTRNFSYDERRNLTKVALVSDANSTDVDWFDALGIRCYSRRYDPAASDPHRLELTNGIRPEVVWEEIYSTTNAGVTTTSGKRYYVLGPNPDERLIWIDATQGTVVARYPHANKRGETIAIAKAGTEDSHYVYGAFGESTDPSSGYPWRYTGQRLNEWTGLYHYKARAYSPNLGRFLQPDPTGYDDGPNIYAYVLNDPLNAIDADGKQTRQVGIVLDTGKNSIEYGRYKQYKENDPVTAQYPIAEGRYDTQANGGIAVGISMGVTFCAKCTEGDLEGASVTNQLSALTISFEVGTTSSGKNFFTIGIARGLGIRPQAKTETRIHPTSGSRAPSAPWTRVKPTGPKVPPGSKASPPDPKQNEVVVMKVKPYTIFLIVSVVGFLLTPTEHKIVTFWIIAVGAVLFFVRFILRRR